MVSFRHIALSLPLRENGPSDGDGGGRGEQDLLLLLLPQ